MIFLLIFSHLTFIAASAQSTFANTRPSPQCEPNGELGRCGCEPTCGQPCVRICVAIPLLCYFSPKCYCKDGFVKAKNGACIPYSDCALPNPQPEKYPYCTRANEVYHECADVRCGQPVPEPNCDNNDATDYNLCNMDPCPSTTVPPSTISSSNETKYPPFCGGQYSGCRCAPGYKRNINGLCVPSYKCTAQKATSINSRA